MRRKYAERISKYHSCPSLIDINVCTFYSAAPSPYMPYRHDLTLYQPQLSSSGNRADDSCVRNLNSRQFRPTVNQLIFEDLSREIGRNVQIKETKYLACSILGELRVCICICISSEMRSRFSRV